MARVPWTKFQDFYLRLGFLKVLVAALGDERRSVTNHAIITKLETPLFDDVTLHEHLARDVLKGMTWYPRKTPGGRVVLSPEVAEALLVQTNHPSLLYGVTHDTAYKILDWGRDVEFVGRGNQITERALVLRRLMDSSAAESFLSGDPRAWNPFVLEMRERLFFLFHLLEIDRVTVELIRDLGRMPEGTTLETSAASRAACTALFRVLGDAEPELDPRDIPAFRVAQDLACTIAAELDMNEFSDQCRTVSRAVRKTKPVSQMSILMGGASSKKPRRTTKNADHQTIPRFEQLIDLGFLVKPIDEGHPDRMESRRRWRYMPTDACRRWATALGPAASRLHRWNSFASLAVAAFHAAAAPTSKPASVDIIGAYLWKGYQAVHRPMGHTPFDSVALYAMLSAAAEGIVIEMSAFHKLVLAIKKQGLLTDYVFFSSGNDLDKMFIALKPGFVEHLHEVGANLTGENAR